MERKKVYFNFGPDDSYFLRIGEQHRSFGYIAGRSQNQWTGGKWNCFDCVAWKGTSYYFACRRGPDYINQSVIDVQFDPLKVWVEARQHAPLQLVFGEETGCWFAWMLHGDFLMGSNIPTGMHDAAKEAGKVYTSIRCAALGANGAWLLIWDDGSVRVNLRGEYPTLEEQLKGLSGDDITCIAINPFRPGDYFLYEAKTKTASFRVSEAFGKELNDTLISAGITTKEITFSSKALVATPPSLLEVVCSPKQVFEVTTQAVEDDLGALTNAIATVVKVAKVGAALVGVVSCNVM
ncbi:hypothetical protein QBC46DRAFT_359570 [Diplogelasinospora grovesii]|uniref:Uncharacterized protein n=1 Tax=Diplogelasinospora grovesii TaxID=303347 RepID=A0AAN6RY73_9PEZI|nr:hypothetical protein QBC46DRAFT_359570 [Diplogelasinospora grovesii]